MKRFFTAALIIVMLFGLFGCGAKNKAGVGSVDGLPCYTIIMTEEERNTYFTTVGAGGQIAVSDYNAPAGTIYVIDWSAVKGGGWIAWEGGRVRYVSADFDENARKKAFSMLRSDSSAMTIEESREYIPQLAEAIEQTE